MSLFGVSSQLKFVSAGSHRVNVSKPRFLSKLSRVLSEPLHVFNNKPPHVLSEPPHTFSLLAIVPIPLTSVDGLDDGQTCAEILWYVWQITVALPMLEMN